MKLLYVFRRAAAASVFGVAAVSAQAVPVAFSCTTNNSGQCASVAAQIGLDVTDLGGGQASFSFSNIGPIGSALTDIYWRSSALTGGGAIVDSGAGVSFSWGASPSNPGGGIPWNASVAADSDAPAGPNGADPGQWVRFALGYTGTFDDLIASIGGAGQVAIHIQRIGTGDDSEWAVSAPPGPAVPEPGKAVLTLAGLAAVAFLVVRRR